MDAAPSAAPKVFISHSSKDHEFVHKLAADLQRDGVQGWVDEAEIKVGDRLRDKIERGIEQSDFMIVVLSKASTHRGWRSSRWVNVELDAGFMAEMRSQRTVVLPCRIESCRVPELLKAKVYADFAKKPYPEAYQDLLRAILPDGPIPLAVQVELGRLKAQDPSMRDEAARNLGRIGNPVAVPELTEALSDPEVAVRIGAAVGLEHMGAAAGPAVPHLVRCLKSDDAGLRMVSRNALGAIGDRAVSPLIECLHDETAEVRSEAAAALGLIGPAAAPAVARLTSLLQDPDEAVCQNAAEALGSIGKASAPAVPDLIRLLDHRTGEVHRAAAMALGEIGEAAAAAIPILIDRLRGPSVEARAWIAAPLIGIGTPAVPALISCLCDEDPEVKTKATEILGNIGKSAASAVPAVAALLKDDDEIVRQVAEKALAKMQ